MILKGTGINVVDNSGAETAKCIHLYSRSRDVGPGSMILLSLRRVKRGSKLKRGQLFKALVVRNTSPRYYLGGHSLKSDLNCCVLLKKNGDLLGTRFVGPIYSTLIERKLSKSLSLAEQVY